MHKTVDMAVANLVFLHSFVFTHFYFLITGKIPVYTYISSKHGQIDRACRLLTGKINTLQQSPGRCI
jgi:hypothetical protein